MTNKTKMNLTAIFDNIMLNADSYKLSHRNQYPAGCETVYSYIESRGGKWDYSLVFGLQMFLKRYMSNPITMEQIDYAEEFWTAHGEPFYREGWEYILNEHGGNLPVVIKGVPEGTVVPVKNVMVTIENTDPACFWLTSFLETAMLRAVWYPTTVATNSWYCKQVIKKALAETSDDPDQVLFKLHDFGFRGVSSLESGAIGGAAHLVNFMGTDTPAGILNARIFYDEPMAGFSIPASEHSTITSWGRDSEEDAYRNMIKQFGGEGKIVACVSDSYDIYNAVENIWGGSLRDEVINMGGTLVVRPDSGDPVETPIACVKMLADKFGFDVNSKGYKVLKPCVRVIQGDGIDYDTIGVILDKLKEAGFAADNVAFGMGGGLLQQLDRDTLKFAMKCSAMKANGEWVDVYKDPITDPGKRSKRGRLALVQENGEYKTVREEEGGENLLVTVFENGELITDFTFAEVRKRSNEFDLPA